MLSRTVSVSPGAAAAGAWCAIEGRASGFGTVHFGSGCCAARL